MNYNQKRLLMTVGPSSSGKTTFVDKFISLGSNKGKWVDLNRDQVRFELFCDSRRDWTRYKFKKANENKVTEVINKRAQEAVDKGLNIVVSDTNLNPTIREKWINFAKENGYTVEIEEFQSAFTDLMKRNNQREGGISTNILRQQYLRMEEYLGRKTYTPDESKPKAFIVDVDGTVADMSGIRKPYEWDKVHLDKPRDSVIAMVSGLANSGYKIIFLSGRDGVCYHKTRDWLKEYFGNFETLLMRKANDMRKDFIIKEELFWKIADDYNIVGAIDDRHQVLRLWEELGIKDIINVNRGLYNEF